MKNYKFNQKITTYGELKKYVGKPVYLWYRINGVPFTEYAWITTITQLELRYTHGVNDINDLEIKHIDIKGYNLQQRIKDSTTNVKFLYEDDYKVEQSSTAQDFCRTLTKEEFEEYRKATRIRRLWKHT